MDYLRLEGKPLIGITSHADTGDTEDLYPGTPLNYIERKYADILVECGMVPVQIPVHQDKTYIQNILLRLNGIIASGGGKIRKSILNEITTPPLVETASDRYRFEEILFEKALDMDMPILGMCRGMQMINEIQGGTMIRHIPSEINDHLEHNQSNQNIPAEIPTHKIEIKPGSLLSRLIEKEQVEVNSFHRQAVKDPGKGLTICASAPDGVVEALESANHSFVLLTQFHPESLCHSDEKWKRLFDELRIQANQYAYRRCKNF